MDEMTLEAAVLQAHTDGNQDNLIRLYTLAADRAEQAMHIDAACFYLTQAFVYALEHGAPQAAQLHQRLVQHGRDSHLSW